MKRAILIAALALGCDDESLPAKVANAQLHGIVAAQARCSCTMTHPDNWPPLLVTYAAQKLVDGSCLVTGGNLWERSEPQSETCDRNNVWLEGGALHVLEQTGEGPMEWTPKNITTCCTGFGFEAFGVE